jgi:hypothetical protein
MMKRNDPETRANKIAVIQGIELGDGFLGSNEELLATINNEELHHRVRRAAFYRELTRATAVWDEHRRTMAEIQSGDNWLAREPIYVKGITPTGMLQYSIKKDGSWVAQPDSPIFGVLWDGRRPVFKKN